MADSHRHGAFSLVLAALASVVLAAMPERTFVLVGDSSESDDEIDEARAKAHSGRVAPIFIRNITHEPRGHECWT
jgi:phosphatidate phosphatase APP1